MGKKNKKNSSKQHKNQKNFNNKNAAPNHQNQRKKPGILPLKSFIAKVTMLSDWHIGCGAGRTGDIDSLVLRDEDGLPYIPAKTLTGIWRDACELIAFGLDNGTKNGDWQNYVDYLFGEQPNIAQEVTGNSPRAAAFSIRAASLPNNLRKLLSSKDKYQLKQSLTFVKPGIQIEAESGCAKNDFLRFEEMVRGGTVLEAQCELNLPVDKNQKCAAYALLLAGTKLIERLGGKRRRGAGKCQLVVMNQYTEEDISACINWLEAEEKIPAVPLLDEQKIDSQGNYVSNQENTWSCIPLKITAKSPVIISKRTVGNITETLDYIPGTHLLRFVIRKLSNLGINVENAVARGDILVTNAILEINGQQGKPVPLALFYEKLGGGIDKGGIVYNRFLEFPSNGEQLKGYRAGYIGSINNSVLPDYRTVNFTVGTHNTIEDEYQRPTSDIGGVYSYQAIQQGTVLKAELRLKQSIVNYLNKKKQNWEKTLEGEDRLGQSKKDDYGAVKIEVGNLKEQNIKTIISNSELTVWLLSDVLIRDERLRPSTSIDDFRKELEIHLDVDLEIKISESEKLSLIARQNRIESWQVRWGLPRPSLVGIAAGSCFTFKLKNIEQIEESKLTQIQAKLTELEVRGIGERRAEGYGQICFNHPILTTEISKLKNKGQENNQLLNNSNNSSTQLIRAGNPSFEYARIIEKSAWYEAIHRASLFLAASEQFRYEIIGIKILEQEAKKQSKPTMSQLGALRSVLTKLEQPNDAKVMEWLKNLKATANRVEKWDEGKKSLEIFQGLLEKSETVWLHLEKALQELHHQDFTFAELTLTQRGEISLKEELWNKAVQILVDACIRAHKRDLEKENTNSEQGVEMYGS